MLLQRLATGATGVKQARYRRRPTRGSEALLRACAQRNRIKPLRCGHPSIKARGSFPNGGHYRGVPLYCLLAHVIPRREGKRKRVSGTTHIRVNAGKREEVVVIPILVIVMGVVGLLVVVVTYCCCCCKKCCWGRRSRGRQYTLINV